VEYEYIFIATTSEIGIHEYDMQEMEYEQSICNCPLENFHNFFSGQENPNTTGRWFRDDVMDVQFCMEYIQMSRAIFDITNFKDDIIGKLLAQNQNIKN
jgi:hypothetical protein